MTRRSRGQRRSRQHDLSSHRPRWSGADADTWRRHGGRSSFPLVHDLVADPRFSLEALSALAGRLPDGCVETMTAHQPHVLPDGHPSPVPEQASEQQLLHVVELEAWFSLLHIEHDPGYAELLESLLDELRITLDDPRELFGVEGYIFVSAPGAVTPTHVDHEHNLYFQIAGIKTFTVGGFPSAEDEHLAFEGLYSGAYGALDFVPDNAVRHRLEPGHGLYVPPKAAHFVENDDKLSISLSLVFHTPELDREASVYAFNADLRRLGVRPRPPGKSRAVDALKAQVVWAWRSVRRAANGLRPRGDATG